MTASKYGVEANKVWDEVQTNIRSINEYNFRDGVEGMTRMAAKAASLRVNMGTTMQFANKVMNPEGAIEMANAFQRLGAGTSALLDPLKMMDLSMNDPEELQNQLIKMTEQFTKFNSETGRFEITNKRMFRELAGELNINYDQLTKMALGSAELNDKLSRIKFPDFATKEQKEMIAGMAEMKGGEYVVRVMEDGGIKEKKITELSDENIRMLSQQPKSIEEVQKETLTTNQSMAKDVEAIRAAITLGPARAASLEQVSRLSRGFTSTLETFFRSKGLKPETIGGGIDKTAEMIINMMKTGDITGNLLPILQDLKNNAGNLDPAKLTKDFIEMFEKSEIFQSKIFSGGKVQIQKDIEAVLQSLFKVKKTKDAILTDGMMVEPDPEDLILAIKKKNVHVNHSDIPKIPGTSQVVNNINNVKNDDLQTERMMTYMKNGLSYNDKNNNIKTEVTFKDKMGVDLNVNATGIPQQFLDYIMMEIKDNLINNGGLSDYITNAIKRKSTNYGVDGTVNKGVPVTIS
jgi:hypothetical protein